MVALVRGSSLVDLARNQLMSNVSLISNMLYHFMLASMALNWVLNFYIAHVHVWLRHAKETGFFVCSDLKKKEISATDECPSHLFENNEVGCPQNQTTSPPSSSKACLVAFQQHDLSRVFNGLDSDGDGLISTEDIKSLLEKLGLEYICDNDMKTILGFPEHMTSDDFFRLCHNLLEETEPSETHHGVLERGELMEAFCVFDNDGDGFICPSDLQQVLHTLGLREGEEIGNCEKMITKFDCNGDGRIDFMEFENMMAVMKIKT
eukprot:Gb_15095 [translate_table: standard]